MFKYSSIAVASALVLTAFDASANADTRFIYRHFHKSAPASEVTPPEGDHEYRFVDIPLLGLSASKPFMGESKVVLYGKSSRFVVGGAQAAVTAMFFIRGAQSDLEYSPNVFAPSSIMTMPAEALGDVGVDLTDTLFVQGTIPIEYGDGKGTASVSFTNNGKTVSTSFTLPREDFAHQPLSMNLDNWPGLIDYPTMAEQTNIKIRPRIAFRGGVPPYKVVINDTGGYMQASGGSENFTTDTFEADINQSAVNAMSNMNASWQPDPQEMTHVFVLEFVGSGNGLSGCTWNYPGNETVTEKVISVTIVDADGRSVTSPSLTVRHTPDGIRCLAYGLKTQVNPANHLVDLPYIDR